MRLGAPPSAALSVGLWHSTVPLIRPFRITDGETEAQIAQQAGVRADGSVRAQPRISPSLPLAVSTGSLHSFPASQMGLQRPCLLLCGVRVRVCTCRLACGPQPPFRSALYCLPLQWLLLQVGV